MDLSLGLSTGASNGGTAADPSTKGTPGNTSQTTVSVGAGQTTGTTAATATTTLPRMETPIQDEIASATTETPITLTYAASAQVPVLPKPQEEPKVEKKESKSKEEHKTEGSQPEGKSDTLASTDPDVRPQKEQGDEQGGGSSGQQGGDSGGQSGQGSNSGSFSGGSGGHQSSASSHAAKAASSTAAEKTAQTNAASATATASVDASDETKNTTPTRKVDPLNDPTTISASGSYSPPVNPAQFFDNGEKWMLEIQAASAKFMETAPDGPDKFRYVNFLKDVQGAIIAFQELLRSIQTEDSKSARERTQSKLETSLAKIEIQRKQQQEINDKRADAAHKMQIMGPIMAIFAFVMVIVLAALLVAFAAMLLMSGPGGWMALAMLVCEFVDQAATMCGQKPFLMKKFTEAIGNLSDAIVNSCQKTFDLSKEETERGKKISRTVMTSLCMAVAVAAAPGPFVLGGFMALLAFLKESHIITDMQTMEGASKADAAKIEMYVTIAITAAFAIAMIALAIIMPPIGGILIFESISSQLTKAAQTLVKFTTELIALIYNIDKTTKLLIGKMLTVTYELMTDIELWVSYTMLGLTTTEAVINYRYQTLLADIAIIQAELDSEVLLKETIIDMLKKMIKSLMDSLQDCGQQIVQLSDLLKKMHSDSSKISSGLFGA